MNKSYSQFLLLGVLLLVVNSSIDSSSATKNINSDRSLLFALKSQITSDPQHILTQNWTLETNVCSWIGITCDSRYNNRVTQLNISNMGLVGTIPPEMGNLSSLVSLDASENSFHGPIPPSIFNMSRLEVLYLRNNSLSGSLPTNMCKENFHRLKRFLITYNHLHGEIPPSLEQCSKLEFLSMFSNNLSGHVPREIGNLTLLQVLILGDNKLTGKIPREIGNLTLLQTLILGGNKLTGQIPSTVGNLLNLMYLHLSPNKLIGEIPSSMCNLRSLQMLLLSDNNLEGSIPKCLGINLSTPLLIFHLSANQISGLIPSTFSKGCTLQSLNLNGNKLEGELPQSLVNCKALQGIDVGDNEIRGGFPFWMERLPQLRVLVLRSNKFNGTMLMASKGDGLFNKLQVLDISKNEFIGSLPEVYFKNFRGMIGLEEHKTDDGTSLLQRFIESKFTLKGLDLLLQRLLKTFTTIDLSSNRFSGSIPVSIGNLNSLRYLNLSHNTLIGNVPASLGNISVLESLDLSSNKLDGEIPSELTRLTFLSTLNLSVNNLVGQIPQSKQFSTFENDSYMGNSGLCGVPLTRKCKEENVIEQPVEEKEGDDGGFIDGFSWRSVVLGYGGGFAVGIGIGCWSIHYGRPRWLVEIFYGSRYQLKKTRSNRATPTQRHTRS